MMDEEQITAIRERLERIKSAGAPVTASGFYREDVSWLLAALAEARRERDEARAALAMFTHAPNGEAICACRNREAVKAGVARPCAACIARSIIAAAPDGSRDE